jgi:hypothetical protein
VAEHPIGWLVTPFCLRLAELPPRAKPSSLRISRLMVGRMSREEEHDSRSGNDNMDGRTTRTQSTTLRERSVTTDTHHSKSKNSKCMVFSYKLHSIFLLYIYDRFLIFIFIFAFFWVNLTNSLFKECPHPDEKQRMELSKRLCLETRQVKFWFQNRCTYPNEGNHKRSHKNNLTHVSPFLR